MTRARTPGTGRGHLRSVPAAPPAPYANSPLAAKISDHRLPQELIDSAEHGVENAAWRYALPAMIDSNLEYLAHLPINDILVVGWNIATRETIKAGEIPYFWDEPCTFAGLSYGRAAMAVRLLVASGYVHEHSVNPTHRSGVYSLVIPPGGRPDLAAMAAVWGRRPRPVAALKPRPGKGRRVMPGQMSIFDTD